MSESLKTRILHTKTWQITLPNNPDYKLVPFTPEHTAQFLAHCMDPDNNPVGIPIVAWDQARIESWKERVMSRFKAELPDCVELLLFNKQKQVVGSGGLYGWSELNQLAVAGVILSPGVRGMGLGLQIIATLIQLGFDCGLRSIEVGTMLENQAMRTIMRKLGGVETHKRVEIEGRNVVAEIECAFRCAMWTKRPYTVAEKCEDLTRDFG